MFYYYDDSDIPNLISKQYPEFGEKVLEGSNISLWICSGKPPNEYVVPEVVGLTLNEAINKIKKRGFLIGEILYIDNDDFLENTVYEISLLYIFEILGCDILKTTDEHLHIFHIQFNFFTFFILCAFLFKGSTLLLDIPLYKISFPACNNIFYLQGKYLLLLHSCQKDCALF